MTYEEYSASAAGHELIPREDFDFFSKKAEAVLSGLTFGRSVDSELDEVTFAAAEIAQFLYENGGRFGVLRESNDGLSVSYSQDGRDKALYSIAKSWLSGTGLMYAGVDADGNN